MLKNPKCRYNKNTDYPWQTLGNETVIVAPNGKQSFELNELGSFIWKNLNGSNSLEDLSNLIAQEYQVSQDVIQEDLNELVEMMLKAKIILEVKE